MRLDYLLEDYVQNEFKKCLIDKFQNKLEWNFNGVKFILETIDNISSNTMQKNYCENKKKFNLYFHNNTILEKKQKNNITFVYYDIQKYIKKYGDVCIYDVEAYIKYINKKMPNLFIHKINKYNKNKLNKKIQKYYHNPFDIFY